MAREPYGVYSGRYRSPKTGKTVKKWYVRFYSEDGAPIRTKTLKATTATKAGAEAKQLYETSTFARTSDDPLVIDFLRSCWKSDSEYVRRRSGKRKKGPLSKDYISINASIVNKHLVGPFKDIRMSKVSIRLLERIADDMEKQGVSPKTINSAMTAFKIPFRDWCRKNNINNPIQNAEITKAVTTKERGILTIEEMDKIIELKDESPRIRTAILLMGLCGLRVGEARGLMPEDIDQGKGIIHIRHNYINSEGIKRPKNGLERIAPLLEDVDEAIQLCLSIKQNKSPFILFNDKNNKRPLDRQSIANGFKRILKTIGIPEAEQKRRNLVLHGLRHHFVSRGLANGLSAFEIQKFAGHQSDEMMERYSKHTEVIDFKAAREKLKSSKKIAQ